VILVRGEHVFGVFYLLLKCLNACFRRLGGEEEMSGRVSKVLSLVLGVQMFLFGFLKFFQPYDGWFDIQIQEEVVLIACLILFTQMGVAIYVHLQPGVPASVLPLGIKTPYIPVTVLVLGLLDAWLVWKELRVEKARYTPLS
jgi:hypothetical protein